MKKQNIEVEGGELLIMSKEGHYAVIPAKHRQEVMDMVKDGCDDCINSYIQTLPKDSDYAQNGSIYPPEYKAMSKVLSQRNRNLNWVDRGLNPDKYPVIENEDGTISTHRLAYSTGDNGEAYVYPTIIQNDKGELEELDSDSAWEYAKRTKTAMVVPNIKLAEYYSQNGLIKH